MIHIITPCSRPENLPLVYASIPQDCHWVVVMDASTQPYQKSDGFHYFLNLVGLSGGKTEVGMPTVSVSYSQSSGMFGNLCRNQAIDELQAADDDWIYFHDDDNLIHPDWRKGVEPYLESEIPMITWGQLEKDGSVRLPPPKEIWLNHIDTAMYMVRWGSLRNTRFEAKERDADGRLAVELASRHRHKIIEQSLRRYNVLR